MYNIFAGLAFMHGMGWMHRDIKPANVRLNREPLGAVILDLGCSKQGGNSRSHGVGTIQFFAPEILHLRDVEAKYPMKASGILAFTYKVDIFSAALCCAELLFEEHKQSIEDQLLSEGITEEGLRQLTSGLNDKKNKTKGAFSGVYGLLISAQSHNANERPNAGEIEAALSSIMAKLA